MYITTNFKNPNPRRSFKGANETRGNAKECDNRECSEIKKKSQHVQTLIAVISQRTPKGLCAIKYNPLITASILRSCTLLEYANRAPVALLETYGAVAAIQKRLFRDK